MVYYKIIPFEGQRDYIKKELDRSISKLDFLGAYMRISLKEVDNHFLFELGMRADTKFPVVGKALANKYYMDIYKKLKSKFKKRATVLQCEILK